MPFADLDDKNDGKIIISASPVDRDRMLQIPGSSFTRGGMWQVPLSWASCVVLRSVFGPELELGTSLREWGKAERARIEAAVKLRELLDLPADNEWSAFIDQAEAESGSDMRLKPFQRVDVAYLATMRTAGLFQGMGSGKTGVSIRLIQTLAAAGLDPFPVLIIAPNSIKFTVWPQELEKWAPQLTYSVVDGSAGQRRKKIFARADVTIINWESVAIHSRVAGYGDIRLTDKDKLEKELNDLAPRTVICDEASRLRFPESKQSRAVTWLLHRAQFRYALTGTPLNDDAAAVELWGILHGIAPEWHHGRTRFTQRYVNTGYNLYGGLTVLGLNPAAEAEFRQVTLPLYRRLPKEVILPQLPAKLPVITRHTPMTAKQAKAYREMETSQLAILNDILAAKSQLTVVTRLLQFAAAYASVEYKTAEYENVTITDDSFSQRKAVVTLEEPSSKVDDLMELLEELGDEPLVVGAVSRQLIELAAARLKEAGIPRGLVTGAQSGDERREAVEQFQSGELRVILVTLGAGAEGITLTRSRYLLFMQESYSPAQNDQFTDRVHRIGSEHHTDGIQVIRQVTPGTIEERKDTILSLKHDRIEEVLQDKDTFRRLLGG